MKLDGWKMPRKRKRIALWTAGYFLKGFTTSEARTGRISFRFVVSGTQNAPFPEKNLGRDAVRGPMESPGGSIAGVFARFHPVHMVVYIFKDIDPASAELVKKEPFPLGSQKLFQHDVTRGEI